MSTRIPVGFGPRAPVPRIWRVLEQPEQALERPGAAVRADDPAALAARACAAPSPSAARRARGSGGERRPRPSARPGPSRGSSRSRRRSRRTGPRAESPSSTRTCASGRPSSSAAICAIAVREPVPMSCIAVTTVTRRVGADAHPGIRGRPAAAVPDLAREPDAVLPRLVASARAPRGGAPSAARRGGSTRAGSSRRTGARRGRRRRRGSGGAARAGRARASQPSSSSRHSSPNVPSTKPGARNAAIGAEFSFAPCSVVRDVLDRRRASASARPCRRPSRPSRSAFDELAAESRRACRRSARRCAAAGSSRCGCRRRGSPRAA